MATTALSPRLRQRISFSERQIIRDTNGDRVEVWLPIAGLESVPAEILTGAGREAVAAGQPVSSVAARITCRWQTALANPYGMRITAGGEVYHVETHYTDSTGRRWITLICQKGVMDA